MIKLAVFDWNGTIIADLNMIVAGCNKVLEVYGCKPITREEYRENYVIPFGQTLQKFGVTKEMMAEKGEESLRAFHNYYEPRAAKSRTRTGAKATLEALNKKGIVCIILSNHTMESIYFQLDRLKFTDYFQAVLANEVLASAMQTGKQHRLESYLKDNHIKPHETMIIGDTIEEVHIGQSLGLKTVAITGGYHSTRRLKESNPDLIINSLHGIIENTEDL